MRKLASIRRVDAIKQIEGADAIELAIIGGWQVVVKKNEFQPGQLAVFCEVDSLLPLRDEYEFLRKSSYKKMWDGTEGFRLKTIRLRGQLSQGLLLPFSVAVEAEALSAAEAGDLPYPLDEGANVTDLLAIMKYELPPPGVLQGQGKGGLPENAKGAFPGWLPKTEEERIQNCWRDLPKDVDYVATEKLHGTSATYYLRDGEFGICSRNLELKPEMGGLYSEVATEFGIEQKLREWASAPNEFGEQPGVAVQGEIIGEGINGNYYGIEGRHFCVFNVFDEGNKGYLSHAAAEAVTRSLRLPFVPILSATHRLADSCADELLRAEGASVYEKQKIREGYVLRYDQPIGPRVSVKVISNAYLLKEK